MPPFEIPIGKNAFLYTNPINMKWGDKKLTQLCKESFGVDPAESQHVFLFFNKAQDQLRIFFVDQQGPEMITKLLMKGSFILPASNKEDETFIEITSTLLKKLFR